MNDPSRLLDDPGLRLNRRHFFSRTSLGLGGAALASLLSEPGTAGRDPMATRHATPTPSRPMAIDPAGGGILRAYHVPPKAKRVIYLFMSGGPSQLDLFDYKPLLEPDERPGPARVGPDGPAAHGDVGQPGDLADGRLDLQVRPARQVGRLGQRAVAAHGAASSTSSASSTRCTPRRSTTTRRSPSSRPARRSPAGRRWGPGSATAWARPTRTCRRSAS